MSGLGGPWRGRAEASDLSDASDPSDTSAPSTLPRPRWGDPPPVRNIISGPRQRAGTTELVGTALYQIQFLVDSKT